MFRCNVNEISQNSPCQLWQNWNENVAAIVQMYKPCVSWIVPLKTDNIWLYLIIRFQRPLEHVIHNKVVHIDVSYSNSIWFEIKYLVEHYLSAIPNDLNFHFRLSRSFSNPAHRYYWNFNWVWELKWGGDCSLKYKVIIFGQIKQGVKTEMPGSVSSLRSERLKQNHILIKFIY